MACVDREIAAAYLSGDLESVEAQQCAAHLQECASCRAIVEEVSGLMNGAREVLLLVDDPAFESDPPPVEAVRARASAPAGGSKAEIAGPATKNPSLSLAVNSRERKRPTGWSTLSFWLRPRSIITAGVALASLVLLLLWTRGPSVSAAQLLRDARASESTWAAGPNQVIHRTFTIEERHPPARALVARRRVEVWQSAVTGVKVRRLYDEHEALIEGEWFEPDRRRKLYRPNAEPEVLAESQDAASDFLQQDQIWWVELSAGAFSAIVPSQAKFTVTERPDQYILNYQRDSTPGEASLTAASLTLSKPGLHPVEQTLQVTAAGGPREFRFTEEGFARLPANAVSPAVFQPEPALLGPAALPAVRRASANPTPGRLDEAALLKLELRVLHSLDVAGALLGEQVNVGRTPTGTVRVDALVDTEERKIQIVDALKPLGEVPTLKVNVQTFTAAAAEQQARSSGPAILRAVEVRKDQFPVAQELRRFFAGKLAAPPDSGQMDEQIRQFATQTLDESRQVLLQVWALKRLASRFSPEELRTLDAEALAIWQSMVKEHAAEVHRGAGRLEEALEPIFSSQAAPLGAPTSTCSSGVDLTRRVECLLELVHAQDEAIRRDFAVSETTRKGTFVQTSQFWNSLKAIEQLARQIVASQ